MTSSASAQPNPPEQGKSSVSDSQTSPLLSGTEEKSFNYRHLVAVARRRWWLILIVSLSVITWEWTRTLTQSPPDRYRAAFQLLVEPIAGDEEFQQLSEQLGGGRRQGLDYPTQIQVLGSSQVMRPIYEELQEDYPQLSYGELVGELKIRRLGKTKILQISYESENPQLAGAVTKAVAEGYIEYSEKQQQTGEQRVLDLIGEQLPSIRERVEDIQRELQQFRNENNVIDPSATGTLLSENITSLQQREQETKIAIEENMSLRENLLEQLGLGMDEAMTTVALSEAPRYQGLLNQLKEIETKIALELGRFKEESPNIEALKQQREKILELLREESRSVLGNERVTEEIRSQVSSPNPIRLSLTQDLIAATNQIRVLRVRQTALEEAEKNVREELKGTTDLAREYQGITQRLEIAQDNLKRFINLREQLKIKAVQSTLPWQLVEAPFTPTQPLPQDQRGLAFGLMAGILAGAAAAYIAEKIDTKFQSPDDIKDITKLPLLSVVPYQKELQERKRDHRDQLREEAANQHQLSNGGNGNGVENGSQSIEDLEEVLSSHFAETFKTLHTNLSFMNPDRPIKSLVIGSSVPGEGKSTTALNLGQAAAAVGKRVLLVDADMRRPQLHQMLELPNQYGLSNVISTGLKLEEAMQRSPTHSNLYVLTSGPTPPDSNRLLASETMKELNREWENSFDLVIFDTPPMGGLSDAKILAPLTSGLIMVVGLGVSDRTAFKHIVESLSVSRTTVLGIVANSVKKQTMAESSYYYYYYYSSYYNNRYYDDSDSSSQTYLASGSSNRNPSSDN